MIRITIEMVPHGDESKARVLARGKIWNDGTGTVARGNYKFAFSQAGRPSATGRTGEVREFNRLRENVWALLRRCL